MSEPLSLLDLRKELRAIDRIDPETADFGAIKHKYRTLLSGVQVVVGASSGSELFFRVRKNPPRKPTHLSEVGPPPSEAVTGFQRCNAPGTSMFYTSSRRITALKEARVKAGDVVYLTQWMGRDRLPINRILDNDEDQKFLDDLDGYNLIFHTHIDSLFTRRIHQDYSDDYKQSAALSELMTTNFPESDGLVGLRYPSIFDRAGSYNTTFPAAFADGRIGALHITEALIGQPDGSAMPIRILDTAFEFPGGNIVWTGNPALLPLPRENGSVSFRYSGTQWLVGVREAQSSEADLRDFLRE